MTLQGEHRSPTHLWQGFAIPTEQKQKPRKASENSLKMCSFAVSGKTAKNSWRTESGKCFTFNHLQRMNTSSSISFYCRKHKENASGTAPIEVCVIIGGERMTSTLPRRCNSAEFRKKIQSRTQNPIKQYTSAVSEKIEALKTKCLIEGKVFTKEMLRTSTFPSSETYHRS